MNGKAEIYWPMFLFGGLCVASIWITYQALSTGLAWVRLTQYSRSKHPVIYWISVTFSASIACVSAAGVIAFVFMATTT